MLLSLGMVSPLSLVKCIYTLFQMSSPVGWDPCSTWVCPVQGLGGLHKEDWEMLASRSDRLPLSSPSAFLFILLASLIVASWIPE